MINIRQSLKTHLEDEGEGQDVQDIRIGLGYTAVKLQNRATGVANTFVDNTPAKGCSKFDADFCMQNPPAWEVLGLLDSPEVVASALGVACANALANVPQPGLRSGDILEDLLLYSTDNLAMVGNFAPMLPRLRQKVKRVYVLERISSQEQGLIPIDRGSEIIPGCDVAFITSTSIINNTVDDLLELTENCREVVLLGASTPLLPEVFQDTPVTLLSGILVPNPERILQIVSCGGGMQVFKSEIQKVNISVR